MSTRQGNPNNFMRLTGKAFFTPFGETGAIDLGNINAHKLNANVERKEHMSSIHGVKVTDRRDVIGVKPEYEITVDELYTRNLAILVFGGAVEAVTQAAIAAPTGELSITDIKVGRAYDIGKRKLLDVVVEFDGDALTGDTPSARLSNADYTLDVGNGHITFWPGGTNDLSDGDDIDLTFGCSAVVRDSVTPFSVMKRSGTLKIFETDTKNADAPRNEITFPCDLDMDGSPEFKAEDFTTWTLKALVTGKMTMLSEGITATGF